jgi:hypothetical protein
MKEMMGERFHSSGQRVTHHSTSRSAPAIAPATRIVTRNPSHSTAAFRRLCPPASASGTSSPGSLQALGNLPRVRDIFSGRAPEEQASGNLPDRERHPQLCGHAEHTVFHGGWICALRNHQAGGGGVQRLESLLEGLIGVHTRFGRCQLNGYICKNWLSSGTLSSFRDHFMAISGMSELHKRMTYAESGRCVIAHQLS